MKKGIFAVSICIAMTTGSPASATWQDAKGRKWDDITQCVRANTPSCTWLGRMVDQTDQQSPIDATSSMKRGGPVQTPLSFSIVKPGDTSQLGGKVYCLNAADGAVSNMPLHSSKCGAGKSEVYFAVGRKNVGSQNR